MWRSFPGSPKPATPEAQNPIPGSPSCGVGGLRWWEETRVGARMETSPCSNSSSHLPLPGLCQPTQHIGSLSMEERIIWDFIYWDFIYVISGWVCSCVWQVRVGQGCLPYKLLLIVVTYMAFNRQISPSWAWSDPDDVHSKSPHPVPCPAFSIQTKLRPLSVSACLREEGWFTCSQSSPKISSLWLSQG